MASEKQELGRKDSVQCIMKMSAQFVGRDWWKLRKIPPWQSVLWLRC